MDTRAGRAAHRPRFKCLQGSGPMTSRGAGGRRDATWRLGAVGRRADLACPTELRAGDLVRCLWYRVLGLLAELAGYGGDCQRLHSRSSAPEAQCPSLSSACRSDCGTDSFFRADRQPRPCISCRRVTPKNRVPETRFSFLAAKSGPVGRSAIRQGSCAASLQRFSPGFQDRRSRLIHLLPLSSPTSNLLLFTL